MTCGRPRHDATVLVKDTWACEYPPEQPLDPWASVQFDTHCEKCVIRLEAESLRAPDGLIPRHSGERFTMREAVDIAKQELGMP